MLDLWIQRLISSAVIGLIDYYLVELAALPSYEIAYTFFNRLALKVDLIWTFYFLSSFLAPAL